jgi:hypothetical protein
MDDMGRDIVASAKQIIQRSRSERPAHEVAATAHLDQQLIHTVAQLTEQAAQRENQLTKKVAHLEYQLTSIQAKLDRLLNRFDGV